MSALRALLPTVTVGRTPPAGIGSSATTDGTRFKPSTPGITTGVSPSIYATREFVVPRSIPTTRPSAMISLVFLSACRPALSASLRRNDAASAVQGLRYIPHQVAEIPPPVQQGNHVVL